MPTPAPWAHAQHTTRCQLGLCFWGCRPNEPRFYFYSNSRAKINVLFVQASHKTLQVQTTSCQRTKLDTCGYGSYIFSSALYSRFEVLKDSSSVTLDMYAQKGLNMNTKQPSVCLQCLDTKQTFVYLQCLYFQGRRFLTRLLLTVSSPKRCVSQGGRPMYMYFWFFFDDDCFYYHSWRNNVVIAFGTLSSFLT